MENVPFRSKLVQLMQRSRKALRLYSTVEGVPNDHTGELAEIQVAEWRRVNADLLKELGLALEYPNQKRLVAEVFSIRDRFYGEWKVAEADMNRKQRQLVESTENADFMKASSLARELVMLKARAQACQAAHHEVHQVLHRSRMAQPQLENQTPKAESQAMMEEQGEEQVLELEAQIELKEEIKVAKVIPLRRGVS